MTVALLVCIRAIDSSVHPPTAELVRCYVCGAECWRAQSSPKTARVVCLHCVPGEVDLPAEIQPLTEAQQQEILRFFGSKV
jgi:recombinational DNA repair protein (RecF pathway)